MLLKPVKPGLFFGQKPWCNPHQLAKYQALQDQVDQVAWPHRDHQPGKEKEKKKHCSYAPNSYKWEEIAPTTSWL